MITVLGLLGLDFFFYDRKILPCLKEFSRSQPFYSNWFQFSVQNGNQQSLKQAFGLRLTGQMWTLPMLTKFFFRENTVFYPNYYLPMLTKVIWGKIRLFTLTMLTNMFLGKIRLIYPKYYQCLQRCFQGKYGLFTKPLPLGLIRTWNGLNEIGHKCRFPWPYVERKRRGSEGEGSRLQTSPLVCFNTR